MRDKRDNVKACDYRVAQKSKPLQIKKKVLKIANEIRFLCKVKV